MRSAQLGCSPPEIIGSKIAAAGLDDLAAAGGSQVVELGRRSAIVSSAARGHDRHNEQGHGCAENAESVLSITLGLKDPSKL